MNKTYDVYGIGNALLDIDFEVTPETLTRLGIEKSVMTLIDEDQHHALLEDLDGVKHIKASGGSAANTVITTAQLGGKVFYSCKVASDPSGDFFYADLKQSGVDTNLDHHEREHGITGKCIVMVTPDADRTMNTFLGITANFSSRELVPEALKASNYLYIEGFLVASPPSFEAALVAKEIAEKAQVKTALTLSDPNMVLYFKDQLSALMAKKLDLLFCNEHEAQLFCGMDDLDQIQAMLKKVAHSFVITQGPRGALLYDGHETHLIPSHPVKAIDTVGAGDVFAGAYLHGLSQGVKPVLAARLASFAAAKVVSKFGPRLSSSEVAETLSHHEIIRL